MKIIYGKDTEDSLFLNIIDITIRNAYDFPKRFHDYFNEYDGYNTLLKETNEFKVYFQIFKKNENYNFEGTMQQYCKERGTPFQDIFILKDLQWYYCSRETDYILVPCTCKYSNLNNYKLSGIKGFPHYD